MAMAIAEATHLPDAWNGEQVEYHIRELLRLFGEDVQREGLLETPRRVREAWREWTSGYSVDPGDLMKSFQDGADHGGGLIIVREIPVYSHCEHHLAPFFGFANVCYVLNGQLPASRRSRGSLTHLLAASKSRSGSPARWRTQLTSLWGLRGSV